MADYPGAIDYFVDEARVFPGQNDHKAIVLHGTGSPGDPLPTVEQIGDYFRTTPLMTSVHYCVGRDGRIAQYVHESDGAGGNGILDPGHDPFWDKYSDNPNWHSLSIEHVNDSANSLPLTDEQKAASFKLIAYLCKKYGIPPENIKSHASLEPVQRVNCPGAAFPWQELFDYLKGVQMQQYTAQSTDFATYFEEVDANHWQCNRTKNVLQYAIKSFFQTLSIDGQTLPVIGLPTSNEKYTKVNGKTIVIQYFERGIAVYDPSHALDSQPGTQDTYLAKYDDPVIAGVDPARK
jgi:hypothetical protein